MIILPLHKQWRFVGDDHKMTEILGGVNQKVLQNALYLVAVLVDHGFGWPRSQAPRPTTIVTQQICIIFFGGPDDCQALELGGRMAEHPVVKPTIMRFVEKEGLESNGPHGLMLKPSPSKSTDNGNTISTGKMDREKEKVFVPNINWRGYLKA